MSKTKNVPSRQNENNKNGSLSEAKTNEDFNKEKPSPNDPMLKVKKVKK